VGQDTASKTQPRFIHKRWQQGRQDKLELTKQKTTNENKEHFKDIGNLDNIELEYWLRPNFKKYRPTKN
jgi:hypothetical protein